MPFHSISVAERSKVKSRANLQHVYCCATLSYSCQHASNGRMHDDIICGLSENSQENKVMWTMPLRT